MSAIGDEILGANDRVIEPVDVPEWPTTSGKLYVRTMEGWERDAWEQALVTTNGKSVKANMANMRARLVCWCLCDEGGTRLFSDADMPKVGMKSAIALDRVFNVARRVNRLDDKEVEELSRDFAEGQSVGSGSS